jgi:predicted cupin superfamily sugar epimerase
LLTADRTFTRIERAVLGPVTETSQPVHVVPANIWQAGRSRGAYTLVGCTVGPGFDFADFQLLHTLSAEADSARARHPDAAEFI